MPTSYRAEIALQTVEAPGLRFAARFESGATIPLDTRSQPGAASPVEAVLAALGGCGAMDVIGILRKKRQEVTGYEVVVRAERRDEEPRVFTRIEVIHRVRGRNLNERAIEDAIRLSDTKYCSVHAMLAPAVELVSRHEIVPE